MSLETYIEDLALGDAIDFARGALILAEFHGARIDLDGFSIAHSVISTLEGAIDEIVALQRDGKLAGILDSEIQKKQKALPSARVHAAVEELAEIVVPLR